MDLALLDQWMREGKPYAWSEPLAWTEQPKFEIVATLIERWRDGRNGTQRFTILDVGCFTGYFLRQMIHRGPYDGVGVDLHKTLMERLDEKARAMGWPLTFTFSPVEAVPPEPPVDVVVALDVLEHVRDLPAAIAATWAKLRPGGLYVAHVPVEPTPTSEHLRVFTAESLATLWPVPAEVTGCRDEYGRGTLLAMVRKPA